MTAILFDLDGTLLDTLEDLRDAVNHALSLHGFPERTLEEIRRFVGNGVGNLVFRSVPQSTDPETTEAVLRDFRAYYGTHCRVKTRPYEGIPEALGELKGKYPLAIVSNKLDSAVKALCADFFPGIYALGETADCPRKPAPDMLYHAMTAVGADRCIYVGDSEVDVVTAKNADVPCLSVLWGFRDREEIEAAGGSLFCEKPTDLPRILGKLMAPRD